MRVHTAAVSRNFFKNLFHINLSRNLHSKPTLSVPARLRSPPQMATLVVATTADPASINPAKALLAMPGWLPGPTLDGGIRSFKNGDTLRLLEQDKFIIEEDDLDLRWEAATGETVAELFFLSRHAAATGRPALTIHPIGTPTVFRITARAFYNSNGSLYLSIQSW